MCWISILLGWYIYWMTRFLSKPWSTAACLSHHKIMGLWKYYDRIPAIHTQQLIHLGPSPCWWACQLNGHIEIHFRLNCIKCSVTSGPAVAMWAFTVFSGIFNKAVLPKQLLAIKTFCISLNKSHFESSWDFDWLIKIISIKLVRDSGS